LPGNGDFIIPPPENEEYFGKLDFSKPYVCVGGSASAADNQEQSVSHFTRLVNRVKELGLPVYLAQSCGGDRFLQNVARICNVGIIPVNTPIFMAGAILANARLFISGRFHASILASLGGTPCIFLDTHSHKIRSLRETLEYDQKKVFSTYPSDEELNDIFYLGKNYLNQEGHLRKKIKQVAAKRCEEAKKLSDLIQNNL
jgi:ADP-heptose:LPS heptosyltransferase